MIYKIFKLFLVFFPLFLSAQLQLNVKKVDTKNYGYLIPPNFYSNEINGSNELADSYVIFECEIINQSKNDYYLVLDTLSYSMPFTENVNDYFTEYNFKSDPETDNDFGLYAFVYQNHKFLEYNCSSDDWDSPTLEVKHREEDEKQKSLNLWIEKYKFKDNEVAKYNKYLTQNLVKIEAGKMIKYHFAFNPNIKKIKRFDPNCGFYIKSKEKYEINFKLILNKEIKKFFRKDQKYILKKLFIGVLEAKSVLMNY